jgi:hypothetical protein
MSRRSFLHRVGGLVLGLAYPKTAWTTASTNTMMAGGGHNYRTLSKGEKQTEHGSQYEMIHRWIAQKDAVATPPSGRIKKSAMITKPR